MPEPSGRARKMCAARSRHGHNSQAPSRIARASWRPWEGGIQLDIVADHFLYHMVRSIVGTALALQAVKAGAEAQATKDGVTITFEGLTSR